MGRCGQGEPQRIWYYGGGDPHRRYIAVIKDCKLTPSKGVSVKDQYLVSIEAMGLTHVYKKYREQYGKPTFPQQPALFDFADMK